MLTVDEALLNWGLCDTAKQHIDFYLTNYIKHDGTIDYTSWGTDGDSISDYGR